MNRDYFDGPNGWVKAVNLDPRLAQAFFVAMNNYENADTVLKAAAKRKMTPQKMMDLLKSQKVDTVQIEALMAVDGGASAKQTTPGSGMAGRLAQLRMQHPLPGQTPSQPQDTKLVSPVFAPVPQTEDPSVGIPVNVVAGKKPGMFAKMGGGLKRMLVKDKAVSAPEETKPAKEPMSKSKKTMLIVGVTVVVLLVLGLVGYNMFAGGGSSHYDFSNPGPGQPQAGSPLVGTTSLETATLAPGTDPEGETKPTLDNPNPMDIKSRLAIYGFLGSLNYLFFAQILGVVVSLGADVRFRKQWLDGICAVGMALLVIFVTLPSSVPAWVGMLVFGLATTVVGVVSFMGGRDFSPLAAYFLLIGMGGGLLFGKIGLVQAMFPSMSYAAVLPVVQLGIKFSLGLWAELAYPIMVYTIILLGVGFSIFECVRPSEDKTPRTGTFIAGGLGMLVYIGFFYFAHLAPWISYVLAFSVSVLIAALSQNERIIQTITQRWGVRSPFDGAMLVTALLVIVQLSFGILG